MYIYTYVCTYIVGASDCEESEENKERSYTYTTGGARFIADNITIPYACTLCTYTLIAHQASIWSSGMSPDAGSIQFTMNQY